MAATTRMTAQERRAAVLEAARDHFADHGYHGASTDAIARDAGISQPYLFRLFKTKKDLFIAAATACLSETLVAFQEAADGLSGQEALEAIGQRYRTLLSDRQMLKAQMQAYAAACDDVAIQEPVRAGYGALFEYVERVSGASTEVVTMFFAHGMLMNVFAALDLARSDAPWAARMLQSCPGGPS
jgi:AcrR family transcriptional regulator